MTYRPILYFGNAVLQGHNALHGLAESIDCLSSSPKIILKHHQRAGLRQQYLIRMYISMDSYAPIFWRSDNYDNQTGAIVCSRPSGKSQCRWSCTLRTGRSVSWEQRSIWTENTFGGSKKQNLTCFDWWRNHIFVLILIHCRSSFYNWNQSAALSKTESNVMMQSLNLHWSGCCWHCILKCESRDSRRVPLAVDWMKFNDSIQIFTGRHVPELFALIISPRLAESCSISVSLGRRFRTMGIHSWPQIGSSSSKHPLTAQLIILHISRYYHLVSSVRNGTAWGPLANGIDWNCT